MSFVLMFKFDALGTSRERYPQDVTIRRLCNVSPKKRKTIKQLTLSCIRQTFGETKLKILHRKYICTKNSKMTSRTCQGHQPTDVFQGRFQGIHMMPLQNCSNRQQLAFHYFKELIL